jgi:hypothetical protein
VEPNPVIRLAFLQLYAFSLKTGAEFLEGLVEEAREQEEGGSLVEAVRSRIRGCGRLAMVDKATSSTSKLVLLEDRDFEPGVGETGSC